MRSHYWQYLMNEEGQPVAGASIYIQLAGNTVIPVKIYTAETGGVANSTAPQLTTDINGFFEFWIADASETDGYLGSQKFLIRWSKPGTIDDGYIDYVDILPPNTGIFVEIISPSSATLSVEQVSGTVLNNFGQIADAVEQLPAIEAGLGFTVILGTTVAKYYRLQAATNDKIYLNGTAGSNNGYIGISSAAAAATIEFKAFQTDTGKWSWFAKTLTDTWVAG